MTAQKVRHEYFEKMPPKWQTFLIGISGITIFYFLIPHDSWAFYIGNGICTILIILALTHKKSNSPKLVIDQKIIKTTHEQIINLNSVTDVKLVIKGDWTRHKSHYIKLFFAKKSPVEFPVDRLSASPQEILIKIRNKIDAT